MSLNDFVILQKLGSGSFASVYKARRLVDQQIYALKKIDMKALGLKERNNALNEIRLLACLSSPYIIGYCESFFDEKLDVLTIAMEYADEGDLLKKIEKQKKLRSLMPEVEVWKIFIHLLYGLNELHSKNILHRDLKAQNIFIGNGVYKIGDMNVSKIIKNGLACTQTGTPYYASPQVWNDQPYNDKSDIWSLGCILYEVAALRPPYEANSMEKLFDMVTRAPTPKIPTNYSRELQLIIDACLQKNPGNRPLTKELLTNQTLKIYENLVIDFKPEIGSGMKEPLLKTIYMPSSKRELKNQLPQSNYKSSQRKNAQKQEDKQKAENNAHKQVELVKISLLGIENLPKPNQSQKKDESQRNRSRIKSCQIFKDASCKKISSKENLMARADFIIESQRKVSKEKDNQNAKGLHSGLMAKMMEKKTSQKQITTDSKPLVNNSRPQSQKCLSKQIYIEDEEIIIPKRLVFDECLEEESRAFDKLALMNSGSIQRNKIEQIAVVKVQKVEQKMSEPQIEGINREEDTLQKQAYLDGSLNNVSIISQQNHEHYKFDTDVKFDIQSKINRGHQEQSKKIIDSQKGSPQPQAFPAQSYQVCQIKPVSIVIDVNENMQKIKEPKVVTPRSTMSYLLGIQKIKHLTQNTNFKNLLFAFSLIKNAFIKQKINSKQEQFHLKLYHQSHKAVKQTLQPSTKPSSVNTPSKTFQKRSRSKSIRKTEKLKPVATQVNTNSNIALMEKINQKMSIELKKNNNSKEKSGKKERENNKKTIFDKENSKPCEGRIESSYHQNLKQLTLIPKILTDPTAPRVISKQKRKPQNTQHKPKPQALRDLPSNNNITPHKTQKKLSYQGINLFDQKKKKIFESSNPVHELSNQLDRVGLDKKVRKYMNV